MRGEFIMGTGTEVGKTVVAAAIARTARKAGARVAVFKPAVSGLDKYPLRPETWECAAELPTTCSCGSRRDRPKRTMRSRPIAMALPSRPTSAPSWRASR